MVLLKELQDIANVLRRDVLRMTSAAGSGHPTSCLSCAEIMSVLYFSEMKYDVMNGWNPDNDEFILSKGHAAPILYACLKHAGCISEELLRLRRKGSVLEGHPIPLKSGWIKVATGALGQGLNMSIGMALAARLQKRKFRVYALLGDGECAEGATWEAAALASHYVLSNLCAIVDVNRLGQSGETMLGHDLQKYKKRFEAFGWNVIVVDGHSIEDLQKALAHTRKEKKKPSVILAKTMKGKGVSFLENKEGWHGKAVPKDKLEEALQQIPSAAFPKVNIQSPNALTSTITVKKVILAS